MSRADGEAVGPSRPKAVKMAPQQHIEREGSGSESEDWRAVRRLFREAASSKAASTAGGSMRSLRSCSSWKSDKSFVYSRQSTTKRLTSSGKEEVSEGMGSAVVQAARTHPANRTPAQLEVLIKFLQYNRKLKSLRSDDLAAIARAVECVKHRAGAVVFIQGDVPMHVFLVLKGAVDIFIKHADDDEEPYGSTTEEDVRMRVFEEPKDERSLQLPKRSFVSYAKAVEFYGGRVTTLEKTALFGELALLSDSERTATAVCQRDTLLLRLHHYDFDTLMRAGLARQMMPGVECLAPFECFRSVSKHDLAAVCYCFEQVSFQPRKQILVQGSVGRRQDPPIFFVVEGAVVEQVDPLFRRRAEGDQGAGAQQEQQPCTTGSKLLQVSMLHTGSVLGDSTFVEPRVATTFTAATHVVAYRIFKSDVEKRLPAGPLAFLAEVAYRKLLALEAKLAQAELDGLRFGGAQPRKPGERIPGLTGGVVDRSGSSHKSGVAIYQTAKLMKGHDLRRLGNVQGPDESSTAGAASMAQGRRSTIDPPFKPPVSVHHGRDLRVAVDASDTARQHEAEWSRAYYSPGAFSATSSLPLTLADGSTSTLAGPLIHSLSSSSALADSRGGQPQQGAKSDGGGQLMAHDAIVGGRGSPRAPPLTSKRGLPPPPPWNSFSPRPPPALPPECEGTLDGAPTFLTETVTPNVQDEGDEAIDPPESQQAKSLNGRRGDAISSDDAAMHQSRAALNMLHEETGANGLPSSAATTPMMRRAAFNLDDIVADMATAMSRDESNNSGPENLCSMLASDDLSNMLAGLWPQTSKSTQQQQGSLEQQQPPSASVTPGTHRGVRLKPLSRSTGSLPDSNLAIHRGRDSRDDILAALAMGVPLAALTDGAPIEVQTVRPRPDGGVFGRSTTVSNSSSISRSSSTTVGSRMSARPMTPSIPGIVNKPVTSLSEAADDATGRSAVSLASQGGRELRVQQPEALLRLSSEGISALRAEACEEYGYRAAYCTNYLSHYNPRVSLWALELKARGGERQYGKNTPRDRRDREARSTALGARSTIEGSKSKKRGQSVSSHSYSVFDRSQFGV